MCSRMLCVLLATALFSTSQASIAAIQVTFTRLYDTNTTIPGRTDKFAALSEPAFDNDGSVVFMGRGPATTGDWGLYTDIGGVLRLVAGPNTPIPGGSGTFNDRLFRYWLDMGEIAFTNGTSSHGIYRYKDERIEVVADKNTIAPGTSLYFTNLLDDGFWPSISNGQIAFQGGTGINQRGIYLDNGKRQTNPVLACCRKIIDRVG